ncbi:unnamed protein product [Penicillium viridicatum]
MHPSPRFLAAISRSQPSKLKKPSISLDHTRSEVPPSSTRTELHKYARDEFERHRGVSDVVG